MPDIPESENPLENNKPTFTLSHQYGGTDYTCEVFRAPKPTEAPAETLEQKLMRLIQLEVLDMELFCGIMDVPQIAPQSERSA